MLRTILCDEGNRFTEIENPDDISELLVNPTRLIWLDLAQPTAAEFHLIQGEFGLHPLAIEDAMTRHQRPKVEQYENFYFVVFYAVETQTQPGRPIPGRPALRGAGHPTAAPAPPRESATGLAPPAGSENGPPPTPADPPHETQLHPMEWAEDRIVLREISMFMGVNYLITVHQEPIKELEEVVLRWERNVEAITGRDLPLPEEPTADGPAPQPVAPPSKKSGNGPARRLGTENGIGILLYSLLDTLVDNYFPVLDTIVDRMEDLEDEIFTHYTTTSIKTIFTLKKDLLALRRVLAPERDVLNVLIRRDVPIFTGQTLIYFQDVYDHVVRITDSIDTYRDLLSSTIDLYLTMQSNRLNITVQTLTTGSIILMALSLIAGIYGTNFVNIPELQWTYGYYGMLAFMALVALLLYLFFKHKRWL